MRHIEAGMGQANYPAESAGSHQRSRYQRPSRVPGVRSLPAGPLPFRVGRLRQTPSQTPWGTPSPPCDCSGVVNTCWSPHPQSHSAPSLWLCAFPHSPAVGLQCSWVSGLMCNPFTAHPWVHLSQPWVPESTSNGQGGGSAKDDRLWAPLADVSQGSSASG